MNSPGLWNMQLGLEELLFSEKQSAVPRRERIYHVNAWAGRKLRIRSTKVLRGSIQGFTLGFIQTRGCQSFQGWGSFYNIHTLCRPACRRTRSQTVTEKQCDGESDSSYHLSYYSLQFAWIISYNPWIMLRRQVLLLSTLWRGENKRSLKARQLVTGGPDSKTDHWFKKMYSPNLHYVIKT